MQASLGTSSVLLLAALIGVGTAGCNLAPMQIVPKDREVVKEPPPIPEVPSPDPAAAAVPPGWRATVCASGLTYPTSVEVEEDGTLLVAEAGYVYGDHAAPTRILAIDGEGNVSVRAERGLVGPVTDLLLHDGALYVSHRGKISVVEADGAVRDLITDLPSHGDHHNNQLAAGPDGWLYFDQGTVTNAGVVGVDNYAFGWLGMRPDVHDVPPIQVAVKGRTYTTLDPFVLTVEGEGPLARTAAFRPFGGGAGDIQPSRKANGTVLRFRPENAEDTLEVYAWGLRNPFGLAFAGDELYVSENGFDDRGSRPIANAPDFVWRVVPGGFYGWPDYAGGVAVTEARFKPEGKKAPERLLEDHPPLAPGPLVTRPPHTAVAKLAAGPAEAALEPLRGKLVMAEFGEMTPLTGSSPEPAGYQVVAIDPATGKVTPIFRAREEALGDEPLPYVGTAGPRRPIDVVFSPDARSLYVVDLGAVAMLPTAAPTAMPFEGTGVIWCLSPDDDAEPSSILDVRVVPAAAPRD